MKKISVLGLGYIGLPTAILAAQSGYKVLGFDINQDKVEKINSGEPTILEPDVIRRLYQVLDNKNFSASVDLYPAECFLIAVPTPFEQAKTKKEDKKADLTYVFSAAEKVAKVLAHGNLVILESTVPVGTTAKVAKFLEEKSGLKLGLDFFVAHCPERVLPGKIFQELIVNDRVIGGMCQRSAELAREFYSKFVKGHLTLTDDKVAEMVKLVENSSRDVQIAFANQIGAMCQKIGIDPYRVIEFANKHPRVNILNPGCGVGGHCIAVDPWFLIQTFPQDSELLKTTRKINDNKPNQVIEDVLLKIDSLKEKGKSKPNLLVLGLTFKADVDDMRESPALKIALELKKKKSLLDLAICEPNVISDSLKDMGFTNIKGLFEGVAWADLVLILVKHKEFYSIKELDFKNKEIIDSCGLLYESYSSEFSSYLNFDLNKNLNEQAVR